MVAATHRDECDDLRGERGHWQQVEDVLERARHRAAVDGRGEGDHVRSLDGFDDCAGVVGEAARLASVREGHALLAQIDQLDVGHARAHPLGRLLHGSPQPPRRAYREDPQVQKLIKVFFDPRVQPYLKTTTNPALKEQLSPVASAEP